VRFGVKVEEDGDEEDKEEQTSTVEGLLVAWSMSN